MYYFPSTIFNLIFYIMLYISFLCQEVFCKMNMMTSFLYEIMDILDDSEN